MQTQYRAGFFQVIVGNLLCMPGRFAIIFLKIKKWSEVFYCIKLKEIDCLGNSTIYRKNEVQKIYLDTTKIGYNKVFHIKNIPYGHIVADLEVVEALLRKNITAFDAVKLAQEGCEIT